MDAASIAVSRKRRRAKTDRIDGETLIRTLLAQKRGEPRVCSMVRVPTPQDEDRRRIGRERKVLVDERTLHINRMRVGHDVPETRARLFRQHGALPQNAITLINWWIETEVKHERAANRPSKHFARLFYEDGLYPDFMMRLITERTERQTTRTVVLARIKIEDELRGQGHFTTLRETLEGIAIRIGARLQVEQANSDMSSRLMRHGYIRLDPYGKPEADNPKFSGSWWWSPNLSSDEGAADGNAPPR